MFIKQIFTKNLKNKSDTGSVNNLLRDNSPTRLAGLVTVHRGEIVMLIVFVLICGLVIGGIVTAFVISHGQ